MSEAGQEGSGKSLPFGRGRPRVWAGWQHLWSPLDHVRSVATDAVVEVPAEAHEFSGVWNLIWGEHRELTRPVPSEMQPKWEIKQTRSVMLDIKAAAPPGRAFAAQRRISEIFDAGNHLERWSIPIADVPAPLPPASPSPFQHHAFLEMVQHEPLFSGLVAGLERDLDPSEAEAHWGRILASALCFGGLLQARWLAAVPQALTEAERHCAWLDLLDYRVGEARPAHVRWYPDPVTRHLLVRARLLGDSAPVPVMQRSGPSVYRLIRSACRELGIAEHLPRTWQDLQRIVQTHLSVYLPPYLLAHASGRCSAVSLSPAMHRHMQEPATTIHPGIVGRRNSGADGGGAEPSLRSPQGEAVEAIVADDGDEGSGEVDHPALWPAQLRELMKLIRQSDPPEPERIEEWLHQRQTTDGEALLASVVRIAEWVSRWLCRSPHKRRKPRKRTVYERYNAIAGRLVGQLADIDPTDLESAADFVELYGNALEDTVSSGGRKRVAKGLESFHAYLVAVHGVPDDLGGLLRAPRHERTRGVVDAYYLEPARFELAMDWIDAHYCREPRKALMLRLLASLAFYCGLRRSEAAGLLLGDLEDAPDYELNVRPNQHRLLKSSNARRALPLRVLLPEATLQSLIEWRADRESEVREVDMDPATAPLLALPGRPRLRGNDPLYDELTHRLAEATGDPQIRFHHLRHSCASRLIVQLWNAEHAEETKGARLPWATNVGNADPWQLRMELLGQAPVQRRSLRLVARMMGHADTAMTVEHYIHTLDDLLGRAVRRISNHLSSADLAAMTGYSVPHVYEVRRGTACQTSSATLDGLTDRLLAKRDRLAPVERKNVTACRGPIQVAPPPDPIERLLLLTRLINDSHDGQTLSGDVVYPWTDVEIGDYWSRAWNLPAAMRHRVTRGEDGAAAPQLIDTPRTRAEKALARRAYMLLYGGPETGQGGVSAHHRRALLASYRRGIQSGRLISIRFDRVPNFRRWAWLLVQLGLLSEFTAYHIPAKRSEAGSPDRQRSHWQGKGFDVEAADPVRWIRDDDTGARGYVTVVPAVEQRRSTPMMMFGLLWVLSMFVLADEVR